MEGRERMKRFSIISVKKTREGMVGIQDITDVLSCIVDEQWTWVVKPLRDGRFITAFPTTELAKQTEEKGPIRMLDFSLDFQQWSPDLWKKSRAEGAIRWVLVKELPMDCWSRDSAARLLKPAGDLVYIDGQSREYGEDLKVLLRVRKPRRLPCEIHCSIGTRQYCYSLDMVAGQPALPWDTRRRTEQEDTSNPVPAEQNMPNELSQEPVPLQHNSLDKGKAPMVITDKAPARSGGVRPHGIVIKERQSDQGQNRSEQSNRPPVRRALLGTTGQELSTTAPVHGEEDRRSGVGKERAAMGLVTGDKTGHVVADVGVESAVERENFGDVEDARGADVDLYLTAAWKNPCTRKGDSGSIGHPDKLGPSSPVPPRTNLTHCNGSTGSVDRPNKAHL
ncbi:hypothetical protein J5N97_000562 [Dioscorea zingiberensis]|uniref:DUF4283 domain-containing protein n=1 Tax=Dioscorea zingiberensis TaxID=325984 RepID=A0A9D5BVK8_9LILI|nr:hypothetical protein J5N97_000562 [Dioscorea zingiberensis]